MIDLLAEERIVLAKRAPSVRHVVMLAIARAVRDWRIASAQRRIAEQLGALNDHLLNDIGVSRAMIDAAACSLAAAGYEDRQAQAGRR